MSQSIIINVESISIKTDFSYDEIETTLKKISAEKKLNLIIPVDIKSNQLGIMGEIFQLIITWSGYCDGHLYITLSSNTVDLNEKVEAMFTRFWNFLAACMSYDSGIFTSDKVDIKPIVARVLSVKLKELNSNLSWKKGTQEFIPCVKHSVYPLPIAFYHPINRELRSKQEFISLTHKLLTSVAKNYKLSTDISLLKRNQTLIGNVIYELIENTQKWALRDASDEEYFKAVRGLYIASHHGDKTTLLSKCKDDKSLYEYINNPIFNTTEMQFIEISVFDSGPGLAGRWLGLKENEFKSYDQIYEAIMDCLFVNNTSSTFSSYERGYGFYNILKVLGHIGYFKIKTNGLKLYRDFIQTPFVETDNNKANYQLSDWNIKQNNKKLTSFYRGTLCTIIFPINFR